MKVVAIFFWVCLLVSCQSKASIPATDGGVVLETFAVPGSIGASGLARGPDGVIWVAPERDRRLIQIPVSGPVQFIPIDGAPAGEDLESLAWVGGATLAFGTESQQKRLTDPIYLGTITPAGIKLEKRFVFDYGAFSTRTTANSGIEALCAAEGRVVAGSELVLELRGHRVAPLMTFDLKTGAAKRNVVALTSDKGKLSGMTCRMTEDGQAIEVLAIERHYAVSVIIRFLIPLEEKDQEVPSEVVFDFGSRLTPPPNFEGIEWISGDEVMLISDNQFRETSGETLVVRVKLPLHNRAK